MVELVRMWVHPALAEELKIRKEELEKKTGAKINGGMPIISESVAKYLKNKRERGDKWLRVEIQKLRGTSKNEIIYI